MGNCCLMGIGFMFLQDEKNAGNWLKNNMNILNATEMYTCFYIDFFLYSP